MLAFKMPRIISKSGRAQEEAMLVSTWKVVTVPRSRRYLPLALLGAPTTTTSTSSSQITNFRAPRAAQHGRFPSLLPAMPWRRLQLNRSATPTYVSTRGTRGRRIGDRKESLTSASSRGKRTWFLTNQPGEVQLTRYSAKRRARGKIFGFT